MEKFTQDHADNFRLKIIIYQLMSFGLAMTY